MSINSYVAGQLRQPSGRFGKLVMGRLLNLLNRPVNQLVLDSLRLQRDDRFLEVGFGGGDLLHLVAQTVTDGLIAGVDVSEEMVTFCGERLRTIVRPGHLDLRCTSVEKLPYPDNHFTKACAVNTIYFWPDTTQGLNELKRVLRPGGTLAIGFTSGKSMSAMAEHGFSLFEPKEMEWALELAGFTHIGIESRRDWRGDFHCASGVA
jgi:ubiquinone/menaquinone biosynthesis C-methylase UbiE